MTSVFGSVGALVARLGAEGEPLAVVAADIARRLDAGPSDSVAVVLSRELRQLVAALAADREGGDSDVERFLEELRIAPVRDREV